MIPSNRAEILVRVVIHWGGSMITDIIMGVVFFNQAAALWALPLLTLQSPVQSLALSIAQCSPGAERDSGARQI